ncbi:MAG: hypothetical protein ABI587_11590 [Gemmatimonadales bacterium]
MNRTITSTVILAGLLLCLGATTSLSAQGTPGAEDSRLSADTACTIDARPLGDASRSGEPKVWTDSAGMNKPTGPRNCNRKRVAMQADSTCLAMSADSSTYLQGDRAASGKAATPASRMHNPCPQPMGAGVGADTTHWPVRSDSSRARKP